MLDPQSAILSALYRRQVDESARLADAAASLTIWEAAALGRVAVVARLLDADAALANAVAPDGHLPLGLAAFFGRAATVRLLLARGADVRQAAHNDMSVQALHAAVASRSADTVSAVLEASPPVDARQQLGYTPLMGAAAAGRVDLVDLLLQHHANPALRNDEGKSASDVAKEHGHAALAERLAVTAVLAHDNDRHPSHPSDGAQPD